MSPIGALLYGLWQTTSVQASNMALPPPDGAMIAAAEQELQRALGMQLPDQPKPYYVAYEFLDGEYATARARSGVLDAFNQDPYRSVRVEVRVGDYALDNSRYEGDFGEREGVSMRTLPHDPIPVALRREIWLATDEAYKGAAEQFSGKAAAREGRPVPAEPVGSFQPIDPVTTAVSRGAPIDGDATVARVRALSARITNIAGLENAEAIARDWSGTRIVVTSEGTRAWIPTGFSVVRVEGIVRTETGTRLRDCRWWVARTAAELPELDEMVAEVEAMTATLRAASTATEERDYLGPVIFEGAAAVELFRQLLPPEISGTPPAERAPDPYSEVDMAPLPTARIGRRLLPEGWTVLDDPAQAEGTAGHYERDFEGVEPQSVQLIEDGVLKKVLMSRIPRARTDGSTGHGRGLGMDAREAMPGAVQVRPSKAMSNQKLRKRALGLARQADLPYVLVVRRIEPPALAEDFEVAFTGDGPLAGLTRPLEVSRLYRDGREEVVPPTLGFVGVDRRVLRDIAGAGGPGDWVGVLDAPNGPRRFSIGSVGGLPAAWSVPSVVITELELRSLGGGQPRTLAPPGE
ncbi:MAG: hypothetical protein CL927_18775 [Deltaproteobacteria bacterium]|nr:hypothetical protein [Deltaproteobacteria bacterium]